MLRSFRVANHKSIRDEQELMLMPAYDKSRPVVPVAGIFGANASGKTNIIDALFWMQRAVRGSFARWEAGSGVPRQPFRLDPQAMAENSSYVVDILIEDVQYAYGFSVDDARIVEEWLYSYPERRKRVIFERDSDALTFGSTVADNRSRSKLLQSLTRPNSLALSAAAQANQEVVMPVYEWFRSQLRFVGGDAKTALDLDLERVPQALVRHPGMVELLRLADLGIRDLKVDMDEISETIADLGKAEAQQAEVDAVIRELRRKLSLAQEKQLGRAQLAELHHALVDAEHRNRELLDEIRRLLQQVHSSRPRLVFVHGESFVPFGLDDQSDGTVGWLRLLLETLEVLDAGGLLVVDEIDASLHPRLTARLIELFRDERSNPRLAQLVFTSHDATLLGTSFGRDILGRDEIWFAEKDEKAGTTSLFALTDFQPRREDNRVKRYLGGSYGAVPAVFSDTLVRAMTGPEGADAA